MLPGAAPTVTEHWAERIEGRVKLSPLAFCGHTEIGGLNQWIHVWAYKDAAERFRIRDEARAAGAWPPNTRGQFVKQENMLVVPADSRRCDRAEFGVGALSRDAGEGVLPDLRGMACPQRRPLAACPGPGRHPGTGIHSQMRRNDFGRARWLPLSGFSRSETSARSCAI